MYILKCYCILGHLKHSSVYPLPVEGVWFVSGIFYYRWCHNETLFVRLLRVMYSGNFSYVYLESAVMSGGDERTFAVEGN